MRRAILFLTLLIAANLIAANVSALGQRPRVGFERGKIDELKGLTKIYVLSPRSGQSGGQSLVKIVTGAIQKQLPGVEFVTSPADAEIWLSIYAGTASESTRIPPDLNVPPNAQGHGQTRLTYESVSAVRGSVMIRHSGKRRLIREFSKTGVGKKQGAEAFASDFIRIYQKAANSP